MKYSALQLLSKFGLRVDFDLIKRLPSLNAKPEVDLRRHNLHLEKLIRRRKFAMSCPLEMKFGMRM